MAETYSGGCQCGAVRYRIEGELADPNICHCRMCQKAHGAPVVSWASVPVSAIAWTRGQPATFRSSSIAARTFCAACGTPLTFKRDDLDTLDIALATLDRAGDVTPRIQTGIEARMPWFAQAPHLPAEFAGEVNENYQHPDHDTGTWPVGRT